MKNSNGDDFTVISKGHPGHNRPRPHVKGSPSRGSNRNGAQVKVHNQTRHLVWTSSGWMDKLGNTYKF